MSAAPHRSDQPALVGRTVLVVEDHADSRELLVQIFRSLGARTLAAATVHDAEQWLTTRDADLIVCDMKLPDATGLDFIHRIRANPTKASKTPRIAISGYRQFFPPSRVGKDFDAYLEKPVNVDELCALAVSLVTRPRR
jgi:CheY-like chemotaxis protein